MSGPDNLVQVITTLPSEQTAKALAETLLDKKLAACVQISGPITSYYWWHGTKEAATEWLCLAKTTPQRQADLQTLIAECHPYELPEILVIQGTANESYSQWLVETLR